ncbi:MAG: hypothetical protein CVT80_12720 [Alphaproteobacteria bacterium HGW-Alphaproteobacteria-2]|nr:MAG: hypothetical protein CVT80_12720 [Alphaproteobacteria bacterium HGW-Alphaproteobacteria-2]
MVGMGMALALAACTPPDPAATRADARAVLLGLAERNFPGIDPEPGVARYRLFHRCPPRNAAMPDAERPGTFR